MTSHTLCLDQVQLTYGTHAVLDQVSLSIASGELVGVVGTNGAGKSSLLKLLAGLVVPNAGSVSLDGVSLTACAKLSQLRAYMEQEATCHWPLAVEKVVALGRLPYGVSLEPLPARDAQIVHYAMREADVLHLRGRNVMALSSGERARVMLARALAVNPSILLVDEPVAELDPAHQLAVMRLLRQKAEEGRMVVVVLHDLTLAARFCHRLVLLQKGKVVAEGSAETVFTADNLREALQVEAVVCDMGQGTFILPWKEVIPSENI